MTYQEKYIKYKNKYLKLKNNKMYGGYHDIYDLEDNNDIYCEGKQEIVPHKKQIIKMLDKLLIKLDTKIQQTCDDYSMDETKKSKQIDRLENKYDITIKAKYKNYCDIAMPDILRAEYYEIYKKSMFKYLNSPDFKHTFEKLFFNMSPIIFLSENFYPITYPNFVVYTQKRTHYYEIYTNIINELPIQHYLLTNSYTLELINKPTLIINKKLEFPLLSDVMLHVHEINNNNRFVIEGFILAYDLEKMKNILKMYYLHVPEHFNSWIKHFLSFANSILVHQESFKIMDAFIISNNYNMYFENIYMGVLSLNLGQKIINNSFPLETPLIDLSKETNLLIKANLKEKINDPRYHIYEDDSTRKDPIIQFILDNISSDASQLITTYNCGKINYLAKKTITNTHEYFNTNLAELNKYLKFTRTQILTSIVSELYDELYDFLVLSKIVVPYDLLCILNSIYYYRIYNLPNIKNLINYQLQFIFNYEPVINTEHDIATFINKKSETYYMPLQDLLKIFYNNITTKIPNYIMFDYKDPINKVNIIKSDGTMLNNHPICGEITILNLINLLIMEKDKLNVELLPPSTIQPFIDFYRQYNTFNKLKSNIAITGFANMLWKIPFDLINNKFDENYNMYVHYDSENKDGQEIRPSYENICRMLIYLFNIEDLNIYNYEGAILKSLNINSETLKIILSRINTKSIFIDEILKSYNYIKNSNGSISINLKKFGILSLHRNHSEYNLSLSNNNIVTNLKHYTSVKTNFILERYDFLQGDKIYLHYSYCGLIANDYIYSYFNKDTPHNALGFIFLKNLLTKHKYDLLIMDIFEILNIFIDVDYDTYRIVNERVNIFDFIGSHSIPGFGPDHYAYKFIEKNILKYNILRLDVQFIDTINTPNASLLLIMFINECPMENIRIFFPYVITLETIQRLLNLNNQTFKYFNNLIKKFSFQFMDFEEETLLKMFENNYKILPPNTYNYLLNDISDRMDLHSIYPNLLNHIINSKNLNNTSLQKHHKNNIILILCKKYGYNIEMLNYDTLNNLSKLKISNNEIKKMIINGYIAYMLENGTDAELLTNMDNNYDFFEIIGTMNTKSVSPLINKEFIDRHDDIMAMMWR